MSSFKTKSERVVIAYMSLNLLVLSCVIPMAKWDACLSKLFGELQIMFFFRVMQVLTST